MNSKLLKILFKNEKTQKFLCNDLFEELKSVLPTSICFSKNNLINKTREANFVKVQNIIRSFLKETEIYLTKLQLLFNTNNIDEIINHIIICYLFYLSKTNDSLKNINAFTSKLSLGYKKYDYLLAI